MAKTRACTARTAEIERRKKKVESERGGKSLACYMEGIYLISSADWNCGPCV